MDNEEQHSKDKADPEESAADSKLNKRESAEEIMMIRDSDVVEIAAVFPQDEKTGKVDIGKLIEAHEAATGPDSPKGMEEANAVSAEQSAPALSLEDDTHRQKKPTRPELPAAGWIERSKDLGPLIAEEISTNKVHADRMKKDAGKKTEEDSKEVSLDGSHLPSGGLSAPERDVGWSFFPEESEPKFAAGPTRVEQTPAPHASLSSEKTQIVALPVFSEPPPAYIVILRGEEEGREIDLPEGALNMGRGADNDLVFPDIACSRRHSVLEKKDNDYFITDLGSGNGTLVNGQRVQRATLHDGDEVTVGSTIFKFHRPTPAVTGPKQPEDLQVTPPLESTTPRGKQFGASPRSVRGFFSEILSDPQQRKILVFGGGGVLALIILLMLVKLIAGSPGSDSSTTSDVLRNPVQDMKGMLERHLQTAKDHFKNRKWKEAGLEIQLALKMDPLNNAAREYQRQIQKERLAEAALGAARVSMDKKAFASALQELSGIGEDSQFYQDAQKQKNEIWQRQISELLQQGQELMRQKKYSEVIARSDEILKLKADHEGAVKLKQIAQDALQAQQQTPVVAPPEIPRKPIKPVVPIERPIKPITPVERPAKPVIPVEKPVKVAIVPEKPGKGVTGMVLALYKNGEIDQAIEKADSGGATQQSAKLKRIKAAFEQAMELAKNAGQAGRAIEALKQVAVLDDEIASGSGKIHEEIVVKLAKAYYLKGSDSQARQDFPDAFRSYAAALKYKPDLEQARQRLQDLEKQAKKLYEEAYVIMSSNTEEAIKRLDVVLQIIPPGHIYYGKAQKLKKSLQTSGGGEGGSTEDDSGE